MSRTVSDTLKEQLFAQEMDEVVVMLLSITHNDLAAPIYVSSDPTVELETGVRGTVSNGQGYVYLPFELSLQEQSDNLLTRAQITIDNISREIIEAIRTARNTPPIVRAKVVLASDPDTVEFEIPNLRMNNISANAFYVQAELQAKIIQGERYPANSFNQADYPGIYGR